MRRARLVALVVGAGLVLGAVPAVAAVDRDLPEGAVQPDQDEALALLTTAVRAGRELTYTGTQYVATWHGSRSASALAEVRHDPTRGSTVQADEPLAATAVLDPRVLRTLAAEYDLAVVGPGTCTGRAARVVEASRPDGSVAGRFWVDRSSGLLLRREVFGHDGDRVRSSAFVDLEVSDAPALASAPARSTVARLPAPGALQDLREDGWQVPPTLPGGFRLIDTDLSSPVPGRHVLHLAYSDGLSSLSLFSQAGGLGTAPMDGFTPQTVGARPVWVREQTPQRVVWSGGGRVWTLVSDAPAPAVRAVVEALPRDAAPKQGLRTRLARGLGRIGSLLNPFG